MRSVKHLALIPLLLGCLHAGADEKPAKPAPSLLTDATTVRNLVNRLKDREGGVKIRTGGADYEGVIKEVSTELVGLASQIDRFHSAVVYVPIAKIDAIVVESR